MRLSDLISNIFRNKTIPDENQTCQTNVAWLVSSIHTAAIHTSDVTCGSVVIQVLYVSIARYRDGPEWVRQRSVIQKLMMHPTAAQRYLPAQLLVAEDFVTYIRNKCNSDGLVPDFYSDIFNYTMEGEIL